MSLTSPKLALSKPEKIRFLQDAWPGLENIDSKDYERFFAFIDNHLEMKSGRLDPGYFTHTIRDIGEHIRRLREQPALKKAELVTEAGSHLTGEAISRTFELAASFMLGTPVDSDSEYDGINWNSNATLGDALLAEFRLDTSSTGTNRAHDDNIPLTFTMDYLCSRYRYSVKRTDDLTKHLILDKTNSKIMVYEHLICLWNNRRFKQSPFLLDFLKETIDTLILLFPPDKKETKKLLDNAGINFYRLGHCEGKARRKLSEYHYWRDRMTDLKGILDDLPRGKHQLCWDKDGKTFRDWLAFWVTIFLTVLALAFGLGFGIVGALDGTKEYRVSRQQEAIAIGMACADPAVAKLLPKYCP
ncbi:hypothetical protein ONZ43_g6614 [Nemania bipapillata]|uniref:Uncharacterized protein n=1 Tax=Nemania bipapillata TaxID=110536 RepID=A0ACC2HXN5_9PEZI|nr:hypothetical protein ONZ43_g6614 [Nemania bipapillata]